MKFELEIAKIDKKLSTLKEISKKTHRDLTNELSTLEELKLNKLRKIYSNLTDWNKVAVARNPKRPQTSDYIELITTNFVELHGDRLFRDDPALIGGLCKIDNQKFMIIGNQRGKSLDDKIFRNFGMAHPEGYRKALRLFKMAEMFSIPILTLIDTQGAYPGIEAEKRGQGEAIARNLLKMSSLKTPIISVVIGEGGSGGALGLGVSDTTLMLEHSIYSVITPEGCASILFKDATKAEEAATDLKLTAQHLKEFKIIDDIIEEPLGGAHRNYKLTSLNLKKKVLEALNVLKDFTAEELVDRRYNKYRNIGVMQQY